MGILGRILRKFWAQEYRWTIYVIEDGYPRFGIQSHQFAPLLNLLGPVQPDSGVDLWDEPTYTQLSGRSRVDRPERIRDRGGRP